MVAALLEVVVVAVVVVVADPVPREPPPAVVPVCAPTVPVHVAPVGQQLRTLQ